MGARYRHPRHNNEPTRQVFPEHDQRWSLARQLLHDETIAITDRVAGLLVLLYAQRITRITQLTRKQVTHTESGVELLLGREPISVPTGLGDLINGLVEHVLTAAAIDSSDDTWLFPSARPGQPVPPRTLARRLAAISVPVTIGRNTALMELAGEMPAAITSGLLGISIDRATRWTHDAGNIRSGYAAEIARRR
jgi:hypothetical protein